MKKLIPVLTEKSMEDAQDGVYTFYVEPNTTKHQTKLLVGTTFGVSVKTVRTVNIKGETKRQFNGRYRVTKPKKKVMVTLAKDQKIDIFTVKK